MWGVGASLRQREEASATRPREKEAGPFRGLGGGRSALPKMRGSGKERGPPEGCRLEHLWWLDGGLGGPLLREMRETYGYEGWGDNYWEEGTPCFQK